MQLPNRQLVPLGEGVYSVGQICRILPGVTPRKVHYWLDTGLLGPPISRGAPGHPTLLSFRQLLQVRTVQTLRDELRFPLPAVREAFQWILDHLFDEEWDELRFSRGVADRRGKPGPLLVGTSTETIVVPGGQAVLDSVIEELTAHLAETRSAWLSRALAIPGSTSLVTDARVLGGSPTVRGTRIETATLAAVAGDTDYASADVAAISTQYGLPRHVVIEALTFEGLQYAA